MWFSRCPLSHTSTASRIRLLSFSLSFFFSLSRVPALALPPTRLSPAKPRCTAASLSCLVPSSSFCAWPHAPFLDSNRALPISRLHFRRYFDPCRTDHDVALLATTRVDLAPPLSIRRHPRHSSLFQFFEILDWHVRGNPLPPPLSAVRNLPRARRGFQSRGKWRSLASRKPGRNDAGGSWCAADACVRIFFTLIVRGTLTAGYFLDAYSAASPTEPVSPLFVRAHPASVSHPPLPSAVFDSALSLFSFFVFLPPPLFPAEDPSSENPVSTCALPKTLCASARWCTYAPLVQSHCIPKVTWAEHAMEPQGRGGAGSETEGSSQRKPHNREREEDRERNGRNKRGRTEREGGSGSERAWCERKGETKKDAKKRRLKKGRVVWRVDRGVSSGDFAAMKRRVMNAMRRSHFRFRGALAFVRAKDGGAFFWSVDRRFRSSRCSLVFFMAREDKSVRNAILWIRPSQKEKRGTDRKKKGRKR